MPGAYRSASSSRSPIWCASGVSGCPIAGSCTSTCWAAPCRSVRTPTGCERRKAHDTLALVHGGSTQGFDTPAGREGAARYAPVTRSSTRRTIDPLVHYPASTRRPLPRLCSNWAADRPRPLEFRRRPLQGKRLPAEALGMPSPTRLALHPDRISRALARLERKGPMPLRPGVPPWRLSRLPAPHRH